MMSDGDPPMDPSGNHASTNPDVEEILNKDETQEGNSDYISLSSDENRTHSRMTSPADSDSEFIDAQDIVEKEKVIDIIVKKSPNSETFMKDVIEECLDLMDTFMKIKESKENQKLRDTSQKENEKIENKNDDTKQTYKEMPSGSTEKKVENNEEENFQLDMEKDGYQLGGTLSMTTVVDENGFTINEELTAKEEEIKISENNYIKEIEIPHDLEKNCTLKIDTDEVAENITKIFMGLEPKSVSKSNIFERSEKLLNTLSTIQMPKLNNFIRSEQVENYENEKPPEIDSSDFETEELNPVERKVSVKDQIKIYESQEKLTGKDSIQKSPSKDSPESKETENCQIFREKSKIFLKTDSKEINGPINKEASSDEISPEKHLTENQTEELSPDILEQLNKPHDVSKGPKIQSEDEISPEKDLTEQPETTDLNDQNAELEIQTELPHPDESEPLKTPQGLFQEPIQSEEKENEISPEKDLTENPTEEPKTTELNDTTAELKNQTEAPYSDESEPLKNPYDAFEEPKIQFEDKENENQSREKEKENSPEEFKEKMQLEHSIIIAERENMENNTNKEEEIKEENLPEEKCMNPTEFNSFGAKEEINENYNNQDLMPETPNQKEFDSLHMEQNIKNINEAKLETNENQKEEDTPNEIIENNEQIENLKAESNHEETTPMDINQTIYNKNLENFTKRNPEETLTPEEVDRIDEEKNVEEHSKILCSELEANEEPPIGQKPTELDSLKIMENYQNQNMKNEEMISNEATEVNTHDAIDKEELEETNFVDNAENIEEKIYEKNFNDGYLEYKNKIFNEDLNMIPRKLELLQKELNDKTSKFENSIYGETFENYNKEIDKVYYLRKKESMQLIEYSPEPLLLKLPQQNICVEIKEEGEKFQIESDSKTCVLDLNLSMKQQINELIENLDESQQENEMEKDFSEIDTVGTDLAKTKYKEEPHTSEMKSSSSAYLITYISEPESLQGSASNTEKKELEGLDDSILKEVAKEEIIRRLDETLDEDIENSKMIEFEAEVKIENDKNLSQSLSSPLKSEEAEEEKSRTALGTQLSTNYSKNMSRSITVSRRAKSPNDKSNQQLKNSKINLPVKNSGIRRLSPSKPLSPRESENPEQLKASPFKTKENEDSEAFPKKSTSSTIKTSGLMTRFNLQLERYHKEVSEFEKLKTNIKTIIKNLTSVHGELATNGSEDLPQLPQDIFEKSDDNQESSKQEEENKKLKESIKKKTGEIDRLKKQLYDFKEDMKHLEEKINMNELKKREERDNNTRLLSQYSNLKEQLERITKEKNDLEQKKNKEIDNLNTRLRAEAKKRDQVEKTINDNICEIDKLKSEKEGLKTRYFNLNETISEKTQKLEKYKNEVKNKKSELEGINKQVNELKKNLEQQNEFIEALKIDIDKTKKELSTSSKREIELSGLLNEKDKVYEEILQKEKRLRQELIDFICDLSSLSEYKITPQYRDLLYSGNNTNEILNEIKTEMENYIEEKNQNLLKRDKTISSLRTDLKERQNLLDVFQSSELEVEVKEPSKTNTDVRSMTAKELIELMENKKQAIEKMETELQSLHSIHSYCGMRRSFLETKINDLEHLLRDYQY